MTIGAIGLGRMGQALVLHLLEKGISVVAYNRSREKTDALMEDIEKEKSSGVVFSGTITPVYQVQDLVHTLSASRIIWLMVDHGKPVDDVIMTLLQAGVEKGDIIIDGGNSHYIDSTRRYTELQQKGISFLDVGTSGGIEGARQGSCMMIGGEKEIYERLIPFFEAATMPGGYQYFGKSGAGHFVKMVHNGVEYGMLQAIGEGFEILKKGPYHLDLHAVASNWTHGSVVRGWLMDLLERAYAHDPDLSAWEGVIGGGSTGSWTQEAAKTYGVSIPVINASMEARTSSQKAPTYSGKVVAALRHQFGGHVVEKKIEKT